MFFADIETLYKTTPLQKEVKSLFLEYRNMFS